MSAKIHTMPYIKIEVTRAPGTTCFNMKAFLLTAFALFLMVIAKAQNSKKMETSKDSLVISRKLEGFYFKGIYEGDIDVLRQVYYPGTLLFGDIKGQPYAKTLEQYLDGVAHRQSPKDSGKPFKGTIISIDVVNSIAVARLHVKMYDFEYEEFISFHKFDERWLIVNKMITDISN
jgi:hypothetical protein